MAEVTSKQISDANFDEKSPKKILSKRATTIGNISKENNFPKFCKSSEYVKEINPNGFINFASPVSHICDDIIHSKVTENSIWKLDVNLLQYNDSTGIFRLRKAFASVVTKMMNTQEPVDPGNLYCMIDIFSAIDVLSHCLFDPGDVVLIPTPVCNKIVTSLQQRSLVEIWPIPLILKEDDEIQPLLSLERIEHALANAKKLNKNVRGIFIQNPHNPLGEIYSQELITKLLTFCEEKKLHVIIDEEYALFQEKNSTFKSIFSFLHLLDLRRIHILYSLNENFAAAGLNIGVIHTTDLILKRSLKELSFLGHIPYPIMNTAARIIEDLDWCQDFATINEQRTVEAFKISKEHFNSMDLVVWNSTAFPFIWVNFRQKCNIYTFDEELKLFSYLFNEYHLCLSPGKQLFCEQPGWFRLTFIKDLNCIEEGLRRLHKGLSTYCKNFN